MTKQILGSVCISLLLPAVRILAEDVARREGGGRVVEMQVAPLDAGLRSLPGNQFVQGEIVVFEVRVSDATALARKERADRDAVREARRAARGEALDLAGERRPPPRLEPIILSTEEESWHDRVEFELHSMREGGAAAGVAEASLSWRPRNILGRKPAARELEFKKVEFWGLDTDTLAPGTYRLSSRLALPAANPAGVASVLNAHARFTLIGRDEASQGQLARVYLREAQAAEKTGATDAAILAGQAGIQRGPVDPYDLATLYRLIGNAHETKGELQDAIEAFQQVKDIAETHFPGRSRLPALMQVRMEQLRRRLNQE